MRGIRERLQGKSGHVAQRHGGFAQRGEAQDGGAEAVFAARSGLLDESPLLQFGQQAIGGGLVQTRQAREVAEPYFGSGAAEMVQQ